MKMASDLLRSLEIGGFSCIVVLVKSDNGYNYEVWQNAPRSLLCSGWTQGTAHDAQDEGESHALEKIRLREQNV